MGNNKIITSQGNVQFINSKGRTIEMHPMHCYAIFENDTVSFLFINMKEYSGQAFFASQFEDVEVNGETYDSIEALKDAITEAFAKAGAQARTEIVETLPSTGLTNTIYLVPKSEGVGYDEYIYTEDGQWELIGDTDIELDRYLQKADFNVYSASTDEYIGSVSGNTVQNAADIASISGSLDTEISAREAADSVISGAVDNVSASLSNEASRALSAETALGGRIDTVNGRVNDEQTARATADNALSGAIDSVISDLASEVSARTDADTALQTAIDNEASARTAAITAVEGQISSLGDSLSAYSTSAEVTAEINAAVSGKADASDVYTKAEVDGAISAATSGKVNTSSVVTSVTSGSTDSEIPTAKAVYDAIPTGGTGGSYSAGSGINIDSANTISAVYRGWAGERVQNLENISTPFYMFKADDCGYTSTFSVTFYINGIQTNVQFDVSTHTYTFIDGDSSWENYVAVEWDTTFGNFKATPNTSINVSDSSCARFSQIFYSGTTVNAIDGTLDRIEYIKTNGFGNNIEFAARDGENDLFIAPLTLNGVCPFQRAVSFSGGIKSIDGKISTQMKSSDYKWMSGVTIEGCKTSTFNAPSSAITFNISRNPSEYLYVFDRYYDIYPILDSNGDNPSSTDYSVVVDNGSVTVSALSADRYIINISDNSCELDQYVSDVQYWGYEVDTIPNVVNTKQDTLSAGTGISIVDNVISATGGGGTTYSAGSGISITNDTISVFEPIFVRNDIDSVSIGQSAQAFHANAHMSLAVGTTNTINKSSSVAFGESNTIGGQTSAAIGVYNKTSNEAELAVGKYNVSSYSSTTFGDSGNTLFSVGNGTNYKARHNAFEIRQNGDIYLTKDGQDVKLQDQLGGGGGTVESAITSGSTNAVESKAIWSATTFNRDVLLTFNENNQSANYPNGCTKLIVEVVGSFNSSDITFYNDNDNLGNIHIGNIGDITVDTSNFAGASYEISGTTVIISYPTVTSVTKISVSTNNSNYVYTAVVEGAWVNENTYMKPEVDGIVTSLQNNINSKLDVTAYTPTVVDSALNVASTNPIQNQALYSELRIDNGETETTLTFENMYSTNYPNGCTQIKVEIAGTESWNSSSIDFYNDNNRLGTINITSLGSIEVTNSFNGASYEISGTTVIISYPTVTSVTKISVGGNNNYVYKAIVANVAPLKDQVAANTAALGGLKLVKLTQAEYDALSPNYDNNTIYFIKD